MKTLFSPQVLEEYSNWATTDLKKFKRVAALIGQCRRQPFSGIGKPEPLKHKAGGRWSRRIDQEHRIVYRVSGTGDDQVLEIAQCRGHYT